MDPRLASLSRSGFLGDDIFLMLPAFTLIIILGCVGGIFVKYLKLPTVIGYLIAGLIGTFILPDAIKHNEGIDVVAQIGVALLLFTLGIELNFKRLNRVLKIAVFGGLIQIILSIVTYQLLLTSFGLTSYEALFLAAGFSLSSTAVVVKILNEKNMMDTIPGEIMVAWLLIQDLAVVPFLILLPLLKNGMTVGVFSSLGFPLLNIFILLAFILLLGRKIAAFIIKKVTYFNSQELLLLTTFSLCLIVASLTEFLGLSFALGAFLAGVMVAETIENHAIFSQMRPIRDLFSVVFFVSLPLLVSPETILPFLPMAFLISILIIVIKFIIIAILTFNFGYHSKVSFYVGIGLIQVGEFAFVLVREGLRQDLIGQNAYSLVLSVTIITILLTPLFFEYATHLYERIRRTVQARIPALYPVIFETGLEKEITEQLPFNDHVVLCGYGRMGRYIGRALESAGIPFIVVDYHFATIMKLKKTHIMAVYGDATNREILDFAQVDTAKILVVALPDLSSQLSIIVHARNLNPTIMIIARTQFEKNQQLIKSVGADVVIHPEFAAAISAVEKVYSLFSVDPKAVPGKIARLKIEHGNFS